MPRARRRASSRELGYRMIRQRMPRSVASCQSTTYEHWDPCFLVVARHSVERRTLASTLRRTCLRHDLSQPLESATTCTTTRATTAAVTYGHIESTCRSSGRADRGSIRVRCPTAADASCRGSSSWRTSDRDRRRGSRTAACPTPRPGAIVARWAPRRFPRVLRNPHPAATILIVSTFHDR